MTNFAQLDENNYVIRIIKIDNSFLMDDGIEKEELGIAKCREIYGQNTFWKQTVDIDYAISTTLKSNDNIVHFPQVGYYYDTKINAFIPPKPYPSFVFDKNTMCWESTIPLPTLTKEQEFLGAWYEWHENTKEWVLRFPQN